MAVRTEPENRFVTYTNWEGYLKYLDAVGEGHTRVTYDRGKLELMTPTRRHERRKSILGRLVEAYMNFRRIRYDNGGSMTFRRQDLERGLEPDECYWIQHVEAVAGGEEYDPVKQPPPDLVLEVDVTSSSIDRVAIYQAMGVPEVWVCDRKGVLSVRVRAKNGTYAIRAKSPTFPDLPLSVIQQVLDAHAKSTVADAVWFFQDWLVQNRPDRR